MMNRKFTKRETFLLTILALLLLGAVYYNVVWQSYTAGIAEAQIRQNEAEMQYYDESARAVQMNKMKDELEKITSSGEEKAPIAEYNNAENVMQTLSTVLSETETYSLSFSPVSFEDVLARRVVNMTFTCNNYTEAKDILTRLQDCGYRCQLGNLGITASAADGLAPDIKTTPVSITVAVTFFETYEAADSGTAENAG